MAFQLPKVRRLIGNFASNCFSSMNADSPRALSVKASMPPSKPTRPPIVAVPSLAPPGNCRSCVRLDAISPQAVCSSVSRAGD